jgi:membrane associated rhomboid family serine protease
MIGPLQIPRGAGWDPSLASIGRREDYRDWGDPGGLRRRIPLTPSSAILGICFIVFLLSLVVPGFVYGYLALNPAHLLGRPWTLITHMFVHANFDHLFWNMLFLFFFGTDLEHRVGERKFLEIYFVSGIVAAMGQILLPLGISSVLGMAAPIGILMGASGALYGVMGCLAIIAPEIRILLFFVIPMRIQLAVLLFALIDFLMLGAADNIAHAAHLTGLVVGLAFGYSMRGRTSYYYV